MADLWKVVAVSEVAIVVLIVGAFAVAWLLVRIFPTHDEGPDLGLLLAKADMLRELVRLRDDGVIDDETAAAIAETLE